jgi:hypothetical protein
MSFTDFLNSIVGIAFFGATLHIGKYPYPSWGGKAVCHLQGTLYPFLAMTTFYILGLLTYERYRAIVVNKRIDQRKAIQSVGLVSVVLLFYSSLPWISQDKIGYNSLKATGAACFCGGGEGKFEQDIIIFINVCFFSITMMAMVYFYGKIYFHIKKIFTSVAVKSSRDEEEAGGGDKVGGGGVGARVRGNIAGAPLHLNTTRLITSVLASLAQTSQQKKKGTPKERKILYQFIVITLFFIGCWAVLATQWLLNSLGGMFIYEPHMDGWTGFGCHLNSALNPFIYGAMNKGLRNAMYDVLPEGLSHWLYQKTYGAPEKAKKERIASTSRVMTDDQSEENEENE